MAVDKKYEADAAVILSHRYDQGGLLWDTPDHRLQKGAPFSTLDCVSYLMELGMEPEEPVLKEFTARKPVMNFISIISSTGRNR